MHQNSFIGRALTMHHLIVVRLKLALNCSLVVTVVCALRRRYNDCTGNRNENGFTHYKLFEVIFLSKFRATTLLNPEDFRRPPSFTALPTLVLGVL